MPKRYRRDVDQQRAIGSSKWCKKEAEQLAKAAGSHSPKDLPKSKAAKAKTAKPAKSMPRPKPAQVSSASSGSQQQLGSHSWCREQLSEIALASKSRQKLAAVRIKEEPQEPAATTATATAAKEEPEEPQEKSGQADQDHPGPDHLILDCSSVSVFLFFDWRLSRCFTPLCVYNCLKLLGQTTCTEILPEFALPEKPLEWHDR
eukprot:7117912-Alexandrium_andersonii.AAC.1